MSRIPCPKLPYKVMAFVQRGVPIRQEEEPIWGKRMWNCQVRADREQKHIDTTLSKRRKILNNDLTDLLKSSNPVEDLIQTYNGLELENMVKLVAESRFHEEYVPSPQSMQLISLIRKHIQDLPYSATDHCPLNITATIDGKQANFDKPPIIDQQDSTLHFDGHTRCMVPLCREKEGAIAFLLHCQKLKEQENDLLRIGCKRFGNGSDDNVEACSVYLSDTHGRNVSTKEITDAVDKIKTLILVSLDSWLELPLSVRHTFVKSDTLSAITCQKEETDNPPENGINWLYFTKLKNLLHARTSPIHTIGERKVCTNKYGATRKKQNSLMEVDDSLLDFCLRRTALREHRAMKEVCSFSIPQNTQGSLLKAWRNMAHDRKDMWKERRVVARLKERLFEELRMARDELLGAHGIHRQRCLLETAYNKKSLCLPVCPTDIKK
ncbi:LysM domain protein [Perkinsela sp. CCAP 1560/4]|nr:LysM domain protein [Perkinsela sp. CCAP 1560/4]|eukprot:KNH05666.1 LysM domain protein [Perkinsela sp. CCAP 1560/4]